MTVSVAWLDDDKSDGFPAVLRVRSGATVIEQRFDFGLNAEIVWSPGRTRFALTGSHDGANGQFRTAVVTVGTPRLGWFDVTPVIEAAVGHPARCDWPEAPNVGAITWLSETRLLVAGEIINHSNCDSFGTFTAYEVDVARRRIERRHDQLDVKRRWPIELGSELLQAPDACITNPGSCRVRSRSEPQRRLENLK